MTVTDAPAADLIPAFTPVVDMLDATVANARHIPMITKKVAGYVTGQGIMWTPDVWALFAHTSTVAIEQDPGADYPLGAGGAVDVPEPDVLDVESGAATPAKAVGWVQRRMKAGRKWSTLYGTDATLAQCRFELAKAGPDGWYFGHVDAWLANWNLNRQEAAALVGTLIHGLTCRAVQWASPTSNPGMLVPGSPLTLAQALVDVSVAAENWPDRARITVPPPPPVPAPTRYALAIDWTAADKPPSVTVLSSVNGGPWK